MFKMGREKRGPLALEAWCRQLTDGYPNVRVDNMTTSWRNGMAFCALIHRFRPELIEYEKLDPSDIIGNCSLAFETAESKLGIPALLDPEDMAANEIPDRLSVLTYVAQFYSLFKNAEKKSSVPSLHRREKDDDLKTRSSDKSTTPNSEKTGAEGTTSAHHHHHNTSSSISRSPSSASSSSFVSATKRRFESSSLSSPTPSSSSSTPADDQSSNALLQPTTAKKSALLLAPPPCSKCQNPVYISERTVFLKKLYHRKCFRCDGCGSMLNPHTADVAADHSSFFCIAKSCQLELLKLNRHSTLNNSNNNSSLNNDSNSSNSSTFTTTSSNATVVTPTVKITDPSLLARSSFVAGIPQLTDNKGENGHVHGGGGKPPDNEGENDNESKNKENLVPLNGNSSNNNGGVQEETEREINDVGGSFGSRGRVSRLSARFESVQKQQKGRDRSAENTATTAISKTNSPISSKKLVDGSSSISSQVNKYADEDSSSNSSASKPTSINSSHPPHESSNDEELTSRNNVRTTGIATTGSLISALRGDYDKDSVTRTGDHVEMRGDSSSKSETKSSNDDVVPPEQPQQQSRIDNVRSNWLQGQIQAKETEEEEKVKSGVIMNSSEHSTTAGEEAGHRHEASSSSSSRATSDIPKVIVSDNNDDEKSNTVSSSSISIEFKLSSAKEGDGTVKDKGDEEENVGDSGISGISSIDNNVVIKMNNGAKQDEDETDERDDERNNHVTPESMSSNYADDDKDQPVGAIGTQAVNDGDNSFQEEKSHQESGESTTVGITSSIEVPAPTSSSAITKESKEPEGNCEVTEGTGKEKQVPLEISHQTTSADDDNNAHSQNPFEDEEEVDQEIDTPRANDDPAEKTQSEQDPVVVEKNNATTTEPILPSNESPEEGHQMSVDTVSSPHQVQKGIPTVGVVSTPSTTNDGLTPSPRKKKRAPQPSPQLIQQATSNNRTPSAPEPVRPMPSPRTRSKRYSTTTAGGTPNASHLNSSSASTKQEEYPAELNPFGDDGEEDVAQPQPSPIPKPRPKPKSTTESPAAANPFDESNDHDVNDPEINNNADTGKNDESHTPLPTIRTSTPDPKPYNPFEDDDEDIGEYEGDDDKPTGIFARRSHDDTSSISSKTSDLSNTSGITAGSHLQKSFNTGSDISSLSGSTKLRSRKSRRAPLPPGMGPQPSSSPSVITHASPNGSGTSSPTPKKVIPVSPELKVIKNQVNKVQYKKKRRAPPPRRRVEPLPEEQIKTELKDLEIKQKELERQGITLEGQIRQQMSTQDVSEENQESNNSEQLDEMIIQLWNIVNEKNDILRRQTELEYLRRSHRLEEMQAELEFQLRILMDTPEDQRADDHARTEQLLLDELLKLVDERNEVVDWLDYYRQMDREEEIHVSKSITQFKSKHAIGLAEMVSQLKLKTKKDKGSKKDKTKSAKGPQPNNQEEGQESMSSTSSSKSTTGKKKLGLFGTLRKKSSKSKTKSANEAVVVDEDKDIDESVNVVK